MEGREEVMNNNTSTTSSVTVVGSDAPSDYHISPAPAPNNNQLTITGPTTATQVEVGPTMAPPPLGVMPLSMKKKRGRPRKYGADGSVRKALSPKPISSAAPPPPPVIDFSAPKRGKIRPSSAGKVQQVYPVKEVEPLGNNIVFCQLGVFFIFIKVLQDFIKMENLFR